MQPITLLVGLFSFFALFRAFAAEIPDGVTDFTSDEKYKDAILSEPFLLTEGGIRIITYEGKKYMFAVGMTPVKADIPPEKKATEILRQKKVAKAKAVSELIKFTESTVESKESYSREKTVTEDDTGRKSITVNKTTKQEYIEQAKAVIKMPQVIAEWKTSEGGVHCAAIGFVISE